MDISYSNLINISQTEKPFRGTTNKFPYDKRTHSTKFFLVEKINGAIEFHLYYGTDYVVHPMTQEEWDAKRPTMSKSQLKKVDNYNGQWSYYENASKLFAIVRQDNSLEITTDDANQGTRLMLSRMLWRNANGGVVDSIRHGGTVYKSYDGNTVIPIFKGLRVYIDTDQIRVHPDCNYKVVTRTLDKSKSSELLKPYRKKFKMVQSMFKAMDTVTFMKDFMNIIVDTNHPYRDLLDGHGFWHDKLDKEAKRYGDVLFETNTVDAMYHYMVADNTHWIRYRIKDYMEHREIDSNTYYSRSLNPLSFFMRARKQFELDKKLSSDIFIKHEYQKGESYPSSIWQIDVILNGQVVRSTQGGK